MNDYNLDFLSDDIQNGLLKNNRVGMIRLTLKFKGEVVEEGFIYLPQFKGFVVLNVKGRFER